MSSLKPYDPLDIPATKEELKSTWKEILQAPITTDDGNTFQFDRDSKEMMEGILAGWDTVGAALLAWRLFDNSVVQVSKGQLKGYYDELIVKQAVRGCIVDPEYVAYKATGPTKRELRGWAARYSPSAG